MSLPNNRYKNILILGGAGFIGSNLAKEYVKLNHKVIIIDGFVKNTGANISNITNFLNDIEFYKEKVENLNNLTEIIEKSDLIIDAMGLTSHSLGMENPIRDIHLNLISHVAVIEALKNSKNKTVFYLGSRAQYGNAKKKVITETTAQNPIDAQGINKMAAEYFYRIFATPYKYRFLSLRISNCFGENQKIDGVDIGLVGSVIRDLMNGKTFEIFEDQNREKYIIYVKDLVDIISKYNLFDKNQCEVYNISGNKVSMKALVDLIIKTIGKGDYIVKPFPQKYKQIDVSNLTFSDGKIKNKLKDYQFTDLSSSIVNTIKYFQKKFGAEL